MRANDSLGKCEQSKDSSCECLMSKQGYNYFLETRILALTTLPSTCMIFQIHSRIISLWHIEEHQNINLAANNPNFDLLSDAKLVLQVSKTSLREWFLSSLHEWTNLEAAIKPRSLLWASDGELVVCSPTWLKTRATAQETSAQSPHCENHVNRVPIPIFLSYVSHLISRCTHQSFWIRSIGD